LFEDKNILITGGTGSLGQALASRLLKYDIKTLRIFSRNENKQIEMQSKFDDSRLRFLIGDIRDLSRISRALEDVNIVFHAAALKHIPIIENNPSEAIMTNVYGSQNVIMACIKNNVEKAVAVGTDKAVSPLNTYGATKLLMEKLFVGAVQEYSAVKHDTRFLALRYGNVLASSGSVIPVFIKQIKNKRKITITDPRMTRFNITMDEAIDFIINSITKSIRSEVFVPKLRAYNIMDLKDALIELLGPAEYETINIRPGEKLHELLINKYELPYTKDLGDSYVIIHPQIDVEAEKNKACSEILDAYKNNKPIEMKDEYSSENVSLMSKEELKKMLKNYI